MTLHPIAPIELALAVEAAGIHVTRTQTLGGWVAVSGVGCV